MKQYKMIGIAVAAFGLASFAMAEGPALIERGIARLEKPRAVAAPEAKKQESAVETTAVATAQEATSLTQ